MGEEPYPVQQSVGVPVEPMQENQRHDLNPFIGYGPTHEKDEAAGSQLEMKKQGPFPLLGDVSEATRRGNSNDNGFGDDNVVEDRNHYGGHENEEKYYDSTGYDDDDVYENFAFYDDTDYYDGDSNNGDERDGENIENAQYWNGAVDFTGQDTNCTDIGGGLELCYQNDVEDTEENGETVYADGDATDGLDEDALWDWITNNYEVKDDYIDDEDDDESDDENDDEDDDEDDEEGDDENDDEDDERNDDDKNDENDNDGNSFSVLVSNYRREPDLYFLDSIPTIERANQVNDEIIVLREPNDENSGSIVEEKKQDSGLQNKWSQHDTKSVGITSVHKIPFEKVYDLVMQSNQVNEEDKHHLASLERVRRQVNRLGGLAALHSESRVHHIVKRQLTGTEACAMFRRRRRRAATEGEGGERSRSRRGISNVGRSLEQGSPRVRQLFNQYKAMCDFISMSVFEK